MRLAHVVVLAAIALLFGCVSTLRTEPVVGCWYANMMGFENRLVLSSNNTHVLSNNFGTSSGKWERVGDNVTLYYFNLQTRAYEVGKVLVYEPEAGQLFWDNVPFTKVECRQ